MTFFVVWLFTEPMEMVLMAYRVLEPWAYLLLQVMKTAFWSVYLAFEVRDWYQGTREDWWRWSIVVAAAVTFVPFLCLDRSFEGAC